MKEACCTPGRLDAVALNSLPLIAHQADIEAALPTIAHRADIEAAYQQDPLCKLVWRTEDDMQPADMQPKGLHSGDNRGYWTSCSFFLIRPD